MPTHQEVTDTNSDKKLQSQHILQLQYLRNVHSRLDASNSYISLCAALVWSARNKPKCDLLPSTESQDEYKILEDKNKQLFKKQSKQFSKTETQQKTIHAIYKAIKLYDDENMKNFVDATETLVVQTAIIFYEMVNSRRASSKKVTKDATKTDFKNFDAHIDQFKTKLNELCNSGFREQANKMGFIIPIIQAGKKLYMEGKLELDEFKEWSLVLINSKRDLIDHHRGCKQIVINLIAAICTLVVPYLIAAALKGDLLVFHPATNTGKIADELDDEISKLNAPSWV